MKQWRQKWTDREQVHTPGNLVQIIGAAQERINMDQTPEKKTRNIEMVGSKKQVAQTAQNWNPKNHQDENMVTPTKQTSAEKKLVVDRDILKERSPQPQRYSPKDHKLSSGGKKLSSSPVLTSADRRAIQVAQVMHEESKEESKGVVEVEEPEQYDEVY